MRIFVGITDFDWYSLHASRENVEEVNFWRPSPTATFAALQPGEPYLFKLHSPRNFIVGGGFFVRFLQLPVSFAWTAFGEANGATSLEEVRVRISRYTKLPIGRSDDPVIGCIMLQEPFFFPEEEWIPVPTNFSRHVQVGKRYDTNEAVGKNLWSEVSARIAARVDSILDPGPSISAAADSARYGNPSIVYPRLGQGAFRVLVTDAYGRRCSISQERTLPVLEAAHIRPYAEGGKHELKNGLLLRSDLHTLFDLGYLTLNPDDRRVIVSDRIREEFENGREYYRFQGARMREPLDRGFSPAREYLQFHAAKVFRG